MLWVGRAAHSRAERRRRPCCSASRGHGSATWKVLPNARRASGWGTYRGRKRQGRVQVSAVIKELRPVQERRAHLPVAGQAQEPADGEQKLPVVGVKADCPACRAFGRILLVQGKGRCGLRPGRGGRVGSKGGGAVGEGLCPLQIATCWRLD